ncbi:MAG: helix-turn-helix transcriptional regulator [Solirubrobacteraceae bacterium]
MPDTLGTTIRAARSAHGLSLQQVAERAGCSQGYVHKLEMDRVRTPSPRVLAGLAEALGLSYDELMRAADYEPTASTPTSAAMPGAIKRYSNAHIVMLLEEIQTELERLRELIGTATRAA